MDSDQIVAALKRTGVPRAEIMEVLGRDHTATSKLMTGKRRVQTHEVAGLLALIGKYEKDSGELADLSPTRAKATVEVEILPTYAGMGGGGSGDGDRQVAILDRGLVEDDLRAKPSDLLVVYVRGDSMEPVFLHGDTLIIDKRDRSPTQPGPFALWFDDGYVVKNVERVRKTGRLRIFSENAKYAADEADPEEVQIMGRPVWFSRAL